MNNRKSIDLHRQYTLAERFVGGLGLATLYCIGLLILSYAVPA